MEPAFERSVWHAETTIPNAHGVAKLLLAQRAKLDVKAVLTGEGADELHGGYAYFRHAALLADAAGVRGKAHAFAIRGGCMARAMACLARSRPSIRRLGRRRAWGVAPAECLMRRCAAISPAAAPFMTTADFRRRVEERLATQALFDWLALRSP